MRWKAAIPSTRPTADLAVVHPGRPGGRAARAAGRAAPAPVATAGDAGRSTPGIAGQRRRTAAGAARAWRAVLHRPLRCGRQQVDQRRVLQAGLAAPAGPADAGLGRARRSARAPGQRTPAGTAAGRVGRQDQQEVPRPHAVVTIAGAVVAPCGAAGRA
ncbi:hypothetical protein G6F68_015745 [Rhizopus microsporus]|nr:hypothetical protein G6F68_015745 [Rhizopus microsporus]